MSSKVVKASGSSGSSGSSSPSVAAGLCSELPELGSAVGSAVLQSSGWAIVVLCVVLCVVSMSILNRCMGCVDVAKDVMV